MPLEGARVTSASSFGAYLKELRVAHGLSQESLAERARMSAAAISALERGSRQAPYRSSVDLLADGLGVDGPVRKRLHQLAAERRKSRALPGDDRAETTRPSGALPVWLNGFFARGREIDELSALLRERRLVTATGPGGVGKTRLAAAVASRLAEDFAEGVYFIELAQLSEPRLVPALLANTFGLAAPSTRSIVDDLCIGLKEREALIVLDNCEHLAGAIADMTTTLLLNCPSLRFLATSRQPLHVQGEAVFVLSPLDAEAAVELFVARAKDAGAQIDPSHRRASIDALCRALDGLPLAIELAAAQARTLSVDQILDGLGRRLDFLRDVASPTAHRHHTIKATIEWSYALLSPNEKRLFHALGAFPASWTLEALPYFASQLPGADVMEIHGSLVDRSLIGIVPHGTANRYAYLETVRAFAADALAENGNYAASSDAFLAFASSIVKRCSAGIGGSDELKSLDELDTEYATIRSALNYTETRPDLAPLAHALVQGLAEYWHIRGGLVDGMEHLSRALRGPRDGIDDDTLDATQLALGRMMRNRGRAPEALALDNVILERARGRHADRLVATALAALGADEFELGNLNDALANYYAAATALRPFGDSPLLVRVLHGAGTIAAVFKRFSEAEELLTESRKVATRIGDQRGLAWVAFRRGFLSMNQQDLGNAERHFQQSFRLSERLGDCPGIAICLEVIGIIRTFQGDYYGAVRALRECIELSQRHGLILRLLAGADRTAYLAYLAGRTDDALSLFAAASAMRLEYSYPMEAVAAADMADLIALAQQSPPVETISDSLDDMIEQALSLSERLDDAFTPCAKGNSIEAV